MLTRPRKALPIFGLLHCLNVKVLKIEDCCVIATPIKTNLPTMFNFNAHKVGAGAGNFKKGGSGNPAVRAVLWTRSRMF